MTGLFSLLTHFQNGNAKPFFRNPFKNTNPLLKTDPVIHNNLYIHMNINKDTPLVSTSISTSKNENKNVNNCVNCKWYHKFDVKNKYIADYGLCKKWTETYKDKLLSNLAIYSVDNDNLCGKNRVCYEPKRVKNIIYYLQWNNMVMQMKEIGENHEINIQKGIPRVQRIKKRALIMKYITKWVLQTTKNVKTQLKSVFEKLFCYQYKLIARKPGTIRGKIRNTMKKIYCMNLQ